MAFIVSKKLHKTLDYNLAIIKPVFKHLTLPILENATDTLNDIYGLALK